MISAEPSVTVVIGCYNHARFVGTALRAFAEQDYPDLRLIVTDDASTDRTRDELEAAIQRFNLSPLRIYHDSNKGVCATFNEALENVDTTLVTFISADDWMTPESVSVRVAALSRAPSNTALVYGDMIMVDADGQPTGSLYSQAVGRDWPGGKEMSVYRELISWDFIPAPTVLMRVDAIRSLHGYDESLPFEDYDMWLRLARHYHLECFPMPVVYYRDHDDSVTMQIYRERQAELWSTNLRLLRKHIGAPGVEPQLTESLFVAARESYLAGSASGDVLPYFRRAAAADLQGAAYFVRWAESGVTGDRVRTAMDSIHPRG